MISEATVSEFIKQFVNELRTALPPDSFQWEKHKIIRTANGYHLEGSNPPEIFNWLLSSWRNQKAFASIGRFIEEIRDDVRYQKIQQRSIEHHNGNVWHWIQPDVVAVQLTVDYLKSIGKVAYVESLVMSIGSEFVRSLDRATSVIICFCALQGVETEVDDVDLGGNLHLRKLSDDEAIQHFEDFDQRLFFDLLMRPPVVAEIRFEFPAGCQPNNLVFQSIDRFDRLLCAFHLLKPGRVDRTGVWERRERSGQFPSLDVLQGGINERFLPVNTYHIAKADIPVFIDLFNFIENGKPSERLQNAISRVNFAVARERLADQILDLMIALEALFGDDSGAIGYKVGMRCSKFIETDPEARIELNEFISNIFKKRHKIVHGGANIEEISSDQSIKLLLIVQKSIRQFIKQISAGGKAPGPREFDALLLK